MPTRFFAPPVELAPYVEALWYSDSGPVEHTRERVLPNGTVSLLFNLLDDQGFLSSWDPRGRQFDSRGPLVAGAEPEYCLINPAQLGTIVGVSFRAAGAMSILNTRVDEITAGGMPLELLWGRTALQLDDALRSARSPHQTMHVLGRWLTARLQPRLIAHPAVKFALREIERAPTLARLHAIKSQAGLSERRLIQLFREQVGLRPKVFCRLKRFQSALQVMSEADEQDWAALALDCGFYDQSHFDNEFKAFSGVTPTEYRARRGPHKNHVLETG